MIIPAGVIAAVKAANEESKAPGLATYQCHKVVKAGKIVRITGTEELEPAQHFARMIVLETAAGFRVPVSDEWLQQHKPELGGYIVEYADGYRSFSPAKAFEDGYTLIDAEGK